MIYLIYIVLIAGFEVSGLLIMVFQGVLQVCPLHKSLILHKEPEERGKAHTVISRASLGLKPVLGPGSPLVKNRRKVSPRISFSSASLTRFPCLIVHSVATVMPGLAH